MLIKEAIVVGSMELKNRLVMPPMATYQSAEDGTVTQALLDYYGQRASDGHIGMIVTEHSYISRQGKAREKLLSLAEDSAVPGLRQLTRVIGMSGTKAMAQLNHACAAPAFAPAGSRIQPPSPLVGGNISPDALTKEQIGEIVADFANAAARAKAAAFDGVEIHCAHAYLLNQFYSPLTNHRGDEYGGTLDNRLRFLLQTVRAVRETVGDSYPLSVRLGGCDYLEGGNSVADSVYAAKRLEEAGVDLISVSGGVCSYERPGHDEPGYFRDMSAAVKSAVKVPVLLTGGVKTLEQAEALLQAGAADLIGVGRALLKDPRWAAGL